MNMRRQLLPILSLVLMSGVISSPAEANRYEIRKEAREGMREVSKEKREARREVLRCKTKECARREIREGYREVNGERREARREIRREIINDRYDRYDHNSGDLLKGIAVGAAVIGIAKAISDNDD